MLAQHRTHNLTHSHQEPIHLRLGSWERFGISCTHAVREDSTYTLFSVGLSLTIAPDGIGPTPKSS